MVVGDNHFFDPKSTGNKRKHRQMRLHQEFLVWVIFNNSNLTFTLNLFQWDPSPSPSLSPTPALSSLWICHKVGQHPTWSQDISTLCSSHTMSDQEFFQNKKSPKKQAALREPGQGDWQEKTGVKLRGAAAERRWLPGPPKAPPWQSALGAASMFCTWLSM
jgi:hypothetical protein